MKKALKFIPSLMMIMVVLPSASILALIAGLQNENPDYFSQVKLVLLYLGSGLESLGESSSATALSSYANGNPVENIMKWVDLKPVLVTAQIGLESAGGDITALNLLLQGIPTGDGSVYSDQLKPILTEIATLLEGLGE